LKVLGKWEETVKVAAGDFAAVLCIVALAAESPNIAIAVFACGVTAAVIQTAEYLKHL
jgi:hypothetical protein